MKIGIDARWIFRNTSGVGVYTRELIRHLARADRRNEYVIFFRDAALMEEFKKEIKSAGAANFSMHLLNFGLFSIKNQITLPSIIRKLNLDVFHSTNYMIPLFLFPRDHSGRTACVINIHDLIPLILPKATPRALKTRLSPIYRWLMKEVTARSSLIITGSQSAQNDIINLLHGRSARIMTIPDGVSAVFHRAKPDLLPSHDPRLLRRNKIILWVGRRDPYKNLTGLIEAFAMLRQHYRGSLELRLVGADDKRYPEAPKRVIDLGLADAVSWVGHVSESELVAEYQNANLFVLPSYYEGFGLPVLEAFACGTPVVCSKKSSLPELCGNAALQVDPKDISGICAAMHRTLTDSRLAGELATRGVKQAAKFNWQETARRTILAYEKAKQMK